VFLRKLFRFVPRSAFGRALGAYSRGEFEPAAAMFEDVLAGVAEPSSDLLACACETYLELAQARDAGGDRAGAVRALERAVQLRPRFADVQLRLGRLCERQDQPQRAQEAYMRALEINPRYFEARLSLARLLMQLEDRTGALVHLHEAARSGPAAAVEDLRRLLHDLPATDTASPGVRPRLVAKIDALLAGSSASPHDAELERARAALRSGDNAAAIATLRGLLQTHVDFPDLHNLLGIAYDNDEMTDDAIEEFEHALRINEHYNDARLNLGLALFERGRDAEAERHLRRAAADPAGSQLAQEVLGHIEARRAVHAD
jgi:tetratricopeptide (TPR) repeat protein